MKKAIIICACCGKAIEPTFKVYDGNMCKDCYYKPVYPELNRNQLWSNNKRGFCKDRAAWNEQAAITNQHLTDKYTKTPPLTSRQAISDPLLRKVIPVPKIEIKIRRLA